MSISKVMPRCFVPGSFIYPAKATTRYHRRLFSSDKPALDRIYEVRTYQCKPDQFAPFLKATQSSNYETRLKKSKLFGFWRVELGSLNSVFHVWEYNSLEHRAEVRKSLGEDPIWSSYYPTIASMWNWQQGHVTKLIPGTLGEPKFSSGVYFNLVFKPSVSEKSFENYVSTVSQMTDAVTIAGFRAIIGEMGTRYLILNADTADAALNALKKLKIEEADDIDSNLLYSLPISPLI